MALVPSGADGLRHSTAETPDSTTAAPAVYLGQGGPTTGATTGFVNIPVMSGAPTGVPTAETGYCAMVIDSTNNKLWSYVNGAWKGVVLA